ncbi:MAG: MMPL family transporter [Demequinaceae bacterium]|nr:MMPL family transporter [Demequinaceae bacterium]
MKIGTTGRIARASARRPWLTLGLWLVGLASAIYAAGFLGDALTQDDHITVQTEWQDTQDLNDHYRGVDSDTETETIIIRSDSARFGEQAFTEVIGEVVDSVSGIEGVVGVSVPTAEMPFPVSESGFTVLVSVAIDASTDSAEIGTALNDAVASVQESGFTVIAFGNATAGVIFDELAEETLVKGEMIGIGVALVILVIVFGALAAAGIPILLAIASIVVAIGLTAIIGQAFEMSFFIVNMITMMGLALSIDYSLLQVQRFREERVRGRSVVDAVTIAGNTANRAVLVSGATVIVSLAGLLVVPSTIMRSLGGGAIVAAVASLLVALTLLPALLRLLGDRVNKGRVPTAHPGRESRRWAGIARTVIARPAVSATIGAGLLLVLAAPALGMRLAFPGLDSLPEDNTFRQAQDILVEDFGWGRSETLVAIDGALGTQPEIVALASAIDADPGFAETSVDWYGDVAFIDTKDFYDSADIRADQSINRLHDEIIPEYLGDTEATWSVGGNQAGSMEFTEVIVGSTPAVLAIVLGASFILLLLAFRSVVIPLMGIALNLLSTAAAFGLMVAVFQHGWGAGILGLPQVDGIAPWIPLFLFAVLFGLSMDYHVFLLSRIKESYDLTGNTRTAIAAGLGRTGSLITGAALIMVAVFAGFALGDLAEFCQMGFGLGAAVIIDATLVRTILVPSVMALLGERNWYLPSWLSWLPNVSIEGGEFVSTPSPQEEAEPALV